jgi:hypothetical protein
VPLAHGPRPYPHAPSPDAAAGRTGRTHAGRRDAAFFAQDGITLEYDAPTQWLARGELFRSLPTASLDRVVGRDVNAWMARGDAARTLRRLQAEMQMLLYTHPLNEERERGGLLPVNSFWASGTGALAPGAGALPSGLRMPHYLRDAALRGDWAAWADAWRLLDKGECLRLLGELDSGHKVTLTLCGERSAQTFQSLPEACFASCPAGWRAPPFHLAGPAMKIFARDVPPRAAWALEQAGVHPLLARLYAARGVSSRDELDDGLARLLPPAAMMGAQAAAVLLADAIRDNQRMCVVADYDCDGATACAVAVRGLRLLGAQHVGYLVPDRVVDGYGLTSPIAQRVKDSGAQLLITVDNGIASVDGVATANDLGLKVLVTDHHLPGAQLPAASVIVNPNQPGCTFDSKSMAGVGVMFYVLLALRSELRTRGVFDQASQPKLDALLPLVALGTVADVVRLDANNRRLVAQGLRRIRAGAMPVGVAALFKAAARDARVATTFDFGFALGPRINAAGPAGRHDAGH